MSGQGRLRSTSRASSSSSGSVKWRPTTCRPIGSPSTSPAGIEIAGLPCRLAGNVSLPLLPAPASMPPNAVGQRALGGEGDVRVARRDDEVDAVDGVEDLRHRLVDLHPRALDAGARRGVVDADGRAPCDARISGVRSSAQSGQSSPSSAAMPIVPLIDHAAPMRGSPVSTPSTRLEAGVARSGRSAAAAEQLPHRRRHRRRRPSRARRRRGGPRSWSVSVPSPASQPSTRGRLSGSRGSWPLATSNQRAVSRTERARQPTDDRQVAVLGVRRRAGSGRTCAFRPTSPREAGRDADRAAAVAAGGERAGSRRRPPPPSRPTSRPACGRAATGCGSTPWSTVRVTLTPPNSLAVVCPARTAPPWSRMRCTIVEVCRGRSVARTAPRPAVSGQPFDLVELLHADRHAAERQGRRRRRPARGRACSRSRWQNAFSVAGVDGGVGRPRAPRRGERSPRRNASTSEQASPCHGVDRVDGRT